MPDVSGYDTIWLGYPNYWGTMPMAVFTFLESCDLTGKRVMPFCTHEGSGTGRSVKDIRTLCPGSEIGKPLAVHGADARGSERDVERWVDEASGMRWRRCEMTADRKEFEKQDVFGIGEPNTAYARFFSGESFLRPLTDPDRTLFLANVTFEPGCRNNWHIHHASSGGGQILVCTAGEGWYQEEGEEAVPLVPGTVVAVPPNVKHWHGARRDTWFSHIAVEVPGADCSNEWCELVTDEEYGRLRPGTE